MDSKENSSTNRFKSKPKKTITKKFPKPKSKTRLNNITNTTFSNERTTLERFVLDNVNVQSESIRTERIINSIEPEKVKKEKKQEVQHSTQILTFPSVSPKQKKDCTNCALLNHRLKMEIQKSANLKMQNSCLENAVAQKREILDHLSVQIKDLHKEREHMFKVLTTIQNEQFSSQSTPAPPKGFKSNGPSSITDFQMGIIPKNLINIKPLMNKPSFNMEEFEDRMLLLQRNMNILSDKMDDLRKENVEKTKFLCNILYSLHAKGYDSIRDQSGKVFELGKIKGEFLFDIRGKECDGRGRIEVKKIHPHEIFLKAVIGSQEKTIRDLCLRIQEIDEIQDIHEVGYQGCNNFMGNYGNERGYETTAHGLQPIQEEPQETVNVGHRASYVLYHDPNFGVQNFQPVYHNSSNTNIYYPPQAYSEGFNSNNANCENDNQ